jgi:hypothetical protein
MKNIFSEKNRAWAYRVLVAVGTLLAGYGVVAQDQLVLWIGVITAILNVMPTANTTIKPESVVLQTGLVAETGQQGPIVAEVK